jgi:hypothetical protein
MIACVIMCRVTQCLSSLTPRDVQRALGISFKSVDWHGFKGCYGRTIALKSRKVREASDGDKD